MYYKGKFSIHNDYLIAFKGFTYPDDYNANDICEIFIDKGEDCLSKLKGEFSILLYDKNHSKIIFVNDKMGRENVFYYLNEKEIFISDDFWEMIILINPKEDDIEPESVRENIVLYYPLFYKTIIKDLNWFPPAVIATFNLTHGSIDVNNYWFYKKSINSNSTLNEEVEKFNDCITKGIKFINNKYDEKTIYGVGISTGLDSRLILPYAKKEKMNLKGFQIGTKKPRKIPNSFYCRNGKKLAKIYNIPFSLVEWDSDTINKKIWNEIRYVPAKNENFIKNVRDKVPKFDVLLTGSSMAVMEPFPYNISNMSKDELLNTILNSWSLITTRAKKKHTHKWFGNMINLIKYIFGRISNNEKYIFSNEDNIIPSFLREEDYNRIIDKLKKDILERSSTQNNFEIYKEYLRSLISRVKGGAYESLGGHIKDSYTLYYPFCFEHLLQVKEEYTQNRILLKYILKKYFPNVAKIPSENAEAPIYYQNKKSEKFHTIKVLIERRLRGSGSPGLGYEKKFKCIFEKVLSKPNSIFDKIIRTDEIEKVEHFTDLYFHIIKTKIVLDLIYYKKYRELIDNNLFLETFYK